MEDPGLLQSAAIGGKPHFSKKTDGEDKRSNRYNRPRDEPFYDKAQSAKGAFGVDPYRQPSGRLGATLGPSSLFCREHCKLLKTSEQVNASSKKAKFVWTP